MTKDTDTLKRELLSMQIDLWLRDNKSKEKIEKRSMALPMQQFDPSSGKIGTIAGYVAKFGVLSVWMTDKREKYREILARDCFKNLVGGDIKALFNHESGKVLGRTGNGTVRLKQDSIGLFSEIDLASTSYSKDLLEVVKRGDVPECSFGFICHSDRWDDTPQGKVRTVLNAELIEISAGVVYPAYSGTGLAARSKKPDESTDAQRKRLLKQLEEMRKEYDLKW